MLGDSGTRDIYPTLISIGSYPIDEESRLKVFAVETEATSCFLINQHVTNNYAMPTNNNCHE